MSLATQNHVGQKILTGLTALGSGQTTAYPLVPGATHEFTTVASSTGAILPVPPKGPPLTVVVTNSGSNTLSVYPPSGGTVAGGSANVAYSVAAGNTAIFYASSLSNYYLQGTTAGATGFSGLTGDVVAGSSGPALLFGQTALITPTIAGPTATNNWSPSGYLTAGAVTANVIRANVTATVAAGCMVTGLAAPSAGGVDGAVVTIENLATSVMPLHLAANSASSSAANRFAFLSDVYLDPGESLQIQYDATQSSWREFGPHRDFRADLWGGGRDGPVTATTGTISQDMYYTDLTIPASVTLTCEGFTIYVNGTLDISAASADSIVWNGGPGANTTTATGGPGGPQNAAATPALAAPPIGATGGAGSTTNGASSAAGVSRVCLNPQACAVGGAGGAGGTGTSGASGAGASGAQGPIPANPLTGYSPITLIPGIAGVAGGGGGGDGTNSGGGGGGSGSPGGTVRIFARKVNRGTNSTAAIFQVKGGVGGNGANGQAGNAGGGGGGGGGQGGNFMLYHGGLFGTAITGAIDVTGGNGGTGGTLHGGSGAANGAGGYAAPSGTAFIQDMRTGAYTLTGSAARVAGSGTTGGTATTTQVTL